MRAFLFAIFAIWTAFLVLVRRSFKGPLHPGWTFRFETVIGIIRRELRGGLGLTPSQIRRGVVAARVHSSLRDKVRRERGTLAGLPTEILTPVGWTPAAPTVLYLHGGGYFMCSPATHRDLISRIAVASGARCIALEYRKAPEHAFPAPIDDAEKAYRELLDSGVAASQIFVAGDSAGGGLTLALLQSARDKDLPMPRAAVLLSPWVDLECTGASITKNAPFDYLPAPGLPWAAQHYLQDGDRKHPYASAVHADLAGFPPLLIQTGGAELFLSENERLAERAFHAGVNVKHEVEPGMIHVFQAFASFLPECEPAISRIGAFVREQAQA